MTTLNIILIDKRVSQYEDIVAAVDPALAVGIVFDYYEDTFETIKMRTRELGLTNIAAVGLIQHNYRAPMFAMLASADLAPVSQVATQDPELAQWTQFKDFIAWCKTDYGAAYFDMMACALYSDPDWKHVIDTLTAQTGVTVRASTDDTGAAVLGGNWFLESHTGVNLKTVYFTEEIEEYRGIFASQGQHYTVLITTTGLIYVAGRNLYGQLGVGDTDNRTTAFTLMPLPVGKTPKMCACGFDHTIVLMTDGSLYGTGYNAQGQLGVGDTTDRTTLTQMSIPADKTPKSVACGQIHTCVLMTDGTVYGTGGNSSSQLATAIAGNKNVLTAMILPTDSGVAKIATKIACGTSHTVVMMSDSTVYGVGSNSNYQLGGVPVGLYGDIIYSNRSSLTLITNTTGKTPSSIFCGEILTIIVMTDGSRYGIGTAWGLGTGNNSPVGLLSPALIATGTHQHISFGSDYSITLMTNGLIYGTGLNGYGRLGININNFTYYTSMVQMVNTTGKTPKSVACGSGHTLVLMTDGTIYGTGINWFGQLGQTMSDSIQLIILPVPGNALIASIGQPLLVTPSLSTFTVAASKIIGDAPFNITTAPTSASSGAITYTSDASGVATINSTTGQITVVSIGAARFIASQAATDDDASATITSNTLTVSIGTPTLSTFTVSAAKFMGAAPFAITSPAPTSASSGAITYTSDASGVAMIHPTTGQITLVGAGSVRFIATQAAVANQYVGATVTSNALIVRDNTTISLVGVSATLTKLQADPPFTIGVSYLGDGAVTFQSSDVTKATVGLTTGLVTIIDVGSTTITVSQASGTFYNAPASITCAITINAVSIAGQTITTSLASKNFTGASFASTVLTNVSLAGATLSGVNFSGATITGANFTNANIVGATNLPVFSTTQKLQLLRNTNNVAISAVQISAPISGADLNAAISTPLPEIAAATFVVKAPAYNANSEKVVTISTADVSGNASIYIPLNDNEVVKINGAAYTFNGTNVLDASNNVITFLTVLNKPFRLYAGSIIGLNVVEKMNNVRFVDSGFYDILSEFFVFKN
jgi:alpha-tubulin suppressor-like RCC1 family protein/uncharacterized protein YjbI with pentapeptide repeats